MFENTHNNHFNWYYDNILKLLRKSKDEFFSVTYGQIKNSNFNFHDSCIDACRIIDCKYSNYYLCISGGVDSQFMAKCFLNVNPNQTALIFNYSFNEEEVDDSKKFCISNNIKYKIIDFDVLKFWDNDLENWAVKYQCSSPQLNVYSKIADLIDEPLIFGSGETVLRRDENSNNFYLKEKETVLSLYKYQTINKKPGCFGFFQYTPEQIFSYLFEKEIQYLIDFGKVKKILGTQKIKSNVYKKYYNDIFFRKKKTGFENKINTCDYHRNHLKQIIFDYGVNKYFVNDLKNDMLNKQTSLWEFVSE